MTRCSSKARGYTLIEVLVAFAILAMTLTILLRIFSTGVRNIEIASQYSEAVLIAEARLDSVGRGEPLVPGRTDGTSNQRYRWTRTITSLQSEALDPKLHAFRILVAVEWPSLSRTRRIELGTVRLDIAETEHSRELQ